MSVARPVAVVIGAGTISRAELLAQRLTGSSAFDEIETVDNPLALVDRAARTECLVVVIDETFFDATPLLLRVLDRFVAPPDVVIVSERVPKIMGGTSRVRIHHAGLPPLGAHLDVLLTKAGSRRRTAIARVTRREEPQPLTPDPVQVVWAKATGDYVRLHYRAGGDQLVRTSMSVIESEWRDLGFVRTHRAFLVATRDVIGVHTTASGTALTMSGGASIPVSRRRRAAVLARLRRHEPDQR